MDERKTRIKLAKAIGVARQDVGYFDPFENAADCEKLIDWLQSSEWYVQVDFPSKMPGVYRAVVQAEDGKGRLEISRGDDWKQCVCKVALKVLEGDKCTD